MSASQILQTPNALSSSLPLPLLLLLLLLPAFLPLISQHPSAAAVTSTSTSFYHNDIKLDFLCRGISGHLSVRDVPWDCASFLVCYRGRAFLHQCPGDRLYNHTDKQRQCLPETEVDASRCRGKLLDYINDICRENPSARIPSAINCAHYVDCESRQKTATGPANKAPAGSLDGLLECSYPKLFSPDTGSCQHHSLVSCGHRFEPTAPYNTATPTSSNADDCAVERGGTTGYWLRKRKHSPSTDSQPRGKRARKSGTDSSEIGIKMECTDPLLMDDLVLDHILEFVDGDTLLTGRLVCQRWKTEITKRNGLWRRRCEGLGADESDKVFPSTTDFFRLFVNLRKEFGEMSFRENWQVNDHCDGSRCVIHKELTRRWERERHEDWVTKIVPRLRKKEHFGKKIVVCTRQGELVVLDEEKKEVAWRTEQLVTAVFTQFKDSIFTVTSLGNIELYSLDGKYKVTETGGKLRGVKAVRSHATAPFLLVWLGGNTLCLVNDKMQVFPLHLPSPQLPEQQDGQEPAEAEPILGLYFNTRVEHTDGQLIVIIKRKSAQCFVIFTTSGYILHHRFLKCDRPFM